MDGGGATWAMIVEKIVTKKKEMLSSSDTKEQTAYRNRMKAKMMTNKEFEAQYNSEK